MSRHPPPGLLPVTQSIAANRCTTPAICLLVRFLTENVTKTHQKKQNKKLNNKELQIKICKKIHQKPKNSHEKRLQETTQKPPPQNITKN
jgi:hypothetical protein